MRKIYFTLTFLLLGVVGVAYLYFSTLNKENDANDHALRLVSGHAGIIFCFDNDKSFYEILGRQQIFDDILGERKSDLLKSLHQYFPLRTTHKFLSEDAKVYIGFIPGNKNSIDFVIAAQPNTKASLTEVINTLKEVGVREQGNYHQLTFPDSTSCFITVHEKYILLANTAESLKKLTTAPISDNQFAQYIKQASRFSKNTLANVYINYDKIPLLLKNISTTPPNEGFSVFGKQNSYAALSYNFSSDKLLLSGYTDIRDPNHYLSLFVNQHEQKITLDQVLPDKTANYIIYAFQDYKQWKKELDNWFQHTKELDKITKSFKQLNNKYRIDIPQSFPQYLQQQIAVFQLNSREKLGVLEINNGDKLEQLLLDISTEYNPDIRIFKEPRLLYYLFGEPFKSFNRPYYTIIDNHFVFANYASSLQVFLNSYKNNQILGRNENYLQFKEQTSSTATISAYISRENSSDIFRRYVRLPYYRQYWAEKGFREYNAFAYQLSADNERFMSNVLLLKKQQALPTDSLTN